MLFMLRLDSDVGLAVSHRDGRVFKAAGTASAEAVGQAAGTCVSVEGMGERDGGGTGEASRGPVRAQAPTPLCGLYTSLQGQLLLSARWACCGVS